MSENIEENRERREKDVQKFKAEFRQAFSQPLNPTGGADQLLYRRDLMTRAREEISLNLGDVLEKYQVRRKAHMDLKAEHTKLLEDFEQSKAERQQLKEQLDQFDEEKQSKAREVKKLEEELSRREQKAYEQLEDINACKKELERQQNELEAAQTRLNEVEQLVKQDQTAHEASMQRFNEMTQLLEEDQAQYQASQLLMKESQAEYQAAKKTLNETEALVKAREEAATIHEADLAEMERADRSLRNDLKSRDAALTQREEAAAAQGKRLDEQRLTIEAREEALRTRSARLDLREQAVSAKENSLAKQAQVQDLKVRDAELNWRDQLSSASKQDELTARMRITAGVDAGSRAAGKAESFVLGSGRTMPPRQAGVEISPARQRITLQPNNGPDYWVSQHKTLGAVVRPPFFAQRASLSGSDSMRSAFGQQHRYVIDDEVSEEDDDNEEDYVRPSSSEMRETFDLSLRTRDVGRRQAAGIRSSPRRSDAAPLFTPPASGTQASSLSFIQMPEEPIRSLMPSSSEPDLRAANVKRPRSKGNAVEEPPSKRMPVFTQTVSASQRSTSSSRSPTKPGRKRSQRRSVSSAKETAQDDQKKDPSDLPLRVLFPDGSVHELAELNHDEDPDMGDWLHGEVDAMYQKYMQGHGPRHMSWLTAAAPFDSWCYGTYVVGRSHAPVWPEGHDRTAACAADIRTGRPCVIHDHANQQVLVLPNRSEHEHPDWQARQIWKSEPARKPAKRLSLAEQLAWSFEKD